MCDALQMHPEKRATEVFGEYFGGRPTLMAIAPGRVNLIGDHTDYNGGFVMPCAIDRVTAVAARPRGDATVRVVAADYGKEEDTFEIGADIQRSAEYPWSNYIRGMAREFVRSGHAPGGVDMAVAGDVPIGAGLSSSASLEMAVATTFVSLDEFDIDTTTMARYGQRVENDFVGVASGIMDQMASALGESGHALLLDCRTLDYELVPVPRELSVVIVDSNIRRDLVSSAYNSRRSECEAAAAALGVTLLRELDYKRDAERIERLAEPLRRRARHVVTESKRTEDAAVALAARDFRRLGALMYESHASLRDDFEVSIRGVDRIVQLLNGGIGENGGARITGAGFGGCVVALVRETEVGNIMNIIEKARLEPLPEIFVSRPAAGAVAFSLS